MIGSDARIRQPSNRDAVACAPAMLVIGAVIGTAVGLATLHYFPDVADALSRFALATLVARIASTRLRTTNYSIVVAAALALESSASIAGAVSRASNRAGAAIGIGVSLSVWPQLSRSRAFEIMGELLKVLASRIERVRDCASDYLRALAAWMRGGGPLPTAVRFFAPLNDMSAAIRSDIAAAISGIEADLRQLQPLSRLSFALEQVGGNLDSIAGHFADRVSRLEDDGTAPALLISHPRQTI
ncbi:hypothetical protein CR51_18585 [Caballeronia megalochromosomata]|nr:hypothetical protein CR51_18585 [Caballeronia megalochromosomata]